MPDLILKSKSDRRLRQGHLWIYSNEVDVSKSPLQNFPAGEQVNVLDAKGKPWVPRSLILNSLFVGVW